MHVFWYVLKVFKDDLSIGWTAAYLDDRVIAICKFIKQETTCYITNIIKHRMVTELLKS